MNAKYLIELIISLNRVCNNAAPEICRCGSTVGRLLHPCLLDRVSVELLAADTSRTTRLVIQAACSYLGCYLVRGVSSSNRLEEANII